MKSLGQKFFIFIAALGILTGSAGLVFAEEGSPHGMDALHQVFFPFINFFLLMGGLIYLLARPTQEFFMARSKKIAEEIEKVTHEKQEIQAKALQYEARLQNIEQEMAALVETSKKEGELIRQKMIEEGKISAARIKELASSIALQELRALKETLKRELIELSTRTAEQMIEQNLQPPDRERLIQENLARLEVFP